MYSFIQYNELDLVRLLVDYGHGVNLRIRFRADNQDHRITPLMLALVCSQQLDDESWTPLHMAATIGKLPIVRTLVEHGAHLDALTDSGETVLCMASPKEVDMDTKAYLLQINAPLWSVPGSSVMVVMPARLRSMLLLEDVLGPLKTSENKEKDDNDS
nr:hypothetical protein BaRGS_022922 [Batillaria attramentaria]